MELANNTISPDQQRLLTREGNDKQQTDILQQRIISPEDPSNNYLCGICLNYLVKAVQTCCGHLFCEMCLSEYLLFFQRCLRCNIRIRNERYTCSLILDQLVCDFVAQYHAEEAKNHQKRISLYRNWTDSRRLKNFEVGQKIDVRDANCIWCPATITRLVSKINQPHRFLKISYENFDRSYDQEVYPYTARVAPHGFYTSHTEIPRYLLKHRNKPNKKARIVASLEDGLVELKRQCDISSSSEEQDDV